MEYTSFEEALKVCIGAENDTPEQREALEYCLRHAPADLRLMLAERLGLRAGEAAHEHGCGCGCGETDREG